VKIYIITCTFNTAQTLIDCAFQKEAEAKAYAAGLNADRAKAVARCRELIVLREGEAMAAFLDEAGSIVFEVLAADLK